VLDSCRICIGFVAHSIADSVTHVWLYAATLLSFPLLLFFCLAVQKNVLLKFANHDTCFEGAIFWGRKIAAVEHSSGWVLGMLERCFFPPLGLPSPTAEVSEVALLVMWRARFTTLWKCIDSNIFLFLSCSLYDVGAHM
jgi:hypothetical protein